MIMISFYHRHCNKVGVSFFPLFSNGVYHQLCLDEKMYFATSHQKKFKLNLDIFISSSIILAVIFNCVNLIGYIALNFVSFKCNIRPQLETYFNCTGATSILTLCTLVVALLSSHNPKETCCNTSSKSSSNW